MSAQPSYQQWLEGACQAAQQTGALILDLYQQQQFETFTKADASPVTSADYAANQMLQEQLKQLTPTIPVLSEETAPKSFAERKNWQRYWLIDPIDGTQEFVAGSGDFAVVIALVEANTPQLGVIYWPTEQRLYYAGRGMGAWRLVGDQQQALQVRKLSKPSGEPIRVAISRRQPLERILTRMNDAREYTFVRTGSCALKACLVAEGSADCFLRVGPTGEWDTAAAEVIVGEAGGQILSEQFVPLTYNEKADLGNPNFLVLGDPAVAWQSVFIEHQQRA